MKIVQFFVLMKIAGEISKPANCFPLKFLKAGRKLCLMSGVWLSRVVVAVGYYGGNLEFKPVYLLPGSEIHRKNNPEGLIPV